MLSMTEELGKKIQAEMDTQRTMFVKGAFEHNEIPEEQANHIFDQIAAFAGYGFNKSHAAAYALLAYQTAWMKAHYPEEFFAHIILRKDKQITSRAVTTRMSDDTGNFYFFGDENYFDKPIITKINISSCLDSIDLTLKTQLTVTK